MGNSDVRISSAADSATTVQSLPVKVNPPPKRHGLATEDDAASRTAGASSSGKKRFSRFLLWSTFFSVTAVAAVTASPPAWALVTIWRLLGSANIFWLLALLFTYSALRYVQFRLLRHARREERELRVSYLLARSNGTSRRYELQCDGKAELNAIGHRIKDAHVELEHLAWLLYGSSIAFIVLGLSISAVTYLGWLSVEAGIHSFSVVAITAIVTSHVASLLARRIKNFGPTQAEVNETTALHQACVKEREDELLDLLRRRVT